MPRSVHDLLQDVLDRGSRIRGYLNGQTRDSFVQSAMLQDCAERNLLILGEALSQAVGRNAALVWKVTDLRKIVAFRHLLAHHYYRVSAETVWGILKSDLARLDREVAALQSALIDMEGEL